MHPTLAFNCCFRFRAVQIISLEFKAWRIAVANMRVFGSWKWQLDLFFISVFLTFFGIITADDCPLPEIIEPCRCSTGAFTLITCTGITDMQTLYNIFQRTADRKFHSFALYNSTVQFLPVSAISSKRFEQIFLQNVSMSAMLDRDPDPSNNVSLIEIKSAKFLKGIGWEHWGNFKILRLVDIQDTEVQVLGKSFVDNMGLNVRRFHMYGSRVRKLQYNAFSRMRDLYDLKIQKGDVKGLRRTMFLKPCRIRNFNFADNQIETLPDDLFTEFPGLQYVDLSGNKISTISKAVFGNVYNNLKEFKMENNPVVCNCDLRWYVDRKRETLTGNCAGPEGMEGKSFQSLKTSDLSYCP